MTINLNNYEEYLLSYIDGELAAAESKELMQFLQDHPELQEELKLLQATKLQPEEGWVFGDKSVLYHRSDENKLISFYRKWWLAAAAAVVLAFIGISFLHRPVQPKNNAEVAISNHRSIISNHSSIDTPVMAPPSKEKTTAGEKQQERLASATDKHEKSLQVTGQSKPARINHQDLLTINKKKPGASGQIIVPVKNKDTAARNLAVNNPAISKQQNNDASDGNPAATNKLPGTEKAASRIPAIAGNGSSKTGKEINNQPDRPEQQQQATTQSLLAKVNGMAAEKTDRILEESAKLAAAKGKLDEKITDKIGDAQNFVVKKFQSIRKKGIRIGRLEIVMN